MSADVSQPASNSLAAVLRSWTGAWAGGERRELQQLRDANARLRTVASAQSEELENLRLEQHTAEAQFRQLADSLLDLIWTTHADGVPEFFNQRWYDYTGLIAGAPTEEGWKRILHPEDLRRYFSCWVLAFTVRCPFQAEFRLKPAQGLEYRWHLLRVVPQRDEAGKIRRWVGTATVDGDRLPLDRTDLGPM